MAKKPTSLGKTLSKKVEDIEEAVADIYAEVLSRPDPEKGDRGEKGEKGDSGERGKEGRKGEKGSKGDKGDKGDPGEPGRPGEAGKDGVAGKDGNDGKDGKDGEDGKTIVKEVVTYRDNAGGGGSANKVKVELEKKLTGEFVPYVGATTNVDLGSNNLTTTGIITGIWNGDPIDIAYGGTGETTANAAFNALAPSQTGKAGRYLKTDGSNTDFEIITETDLTLSDVTTNNSTTSQHGFLPKLSGAPDQFLNGDGNFVTPSGTANAYVSQAFTSVSSVNVIHNFGGKPLVQVLDTLDQLEIPFSVTHNSLNDFTVTFSSPQSGHILATIGSPPLKQQIDISADYTATTDDFAINVDTTSGNVEIFLYTLSGNIGRELLIRKKVAANTITITPDGSDMINGASSLVITSQYTTRTLFTFSDEWGII